jgi:hypothetical protein
MVGSSPCLDSQHIKLPSPILMLVQFSRPNHSNTSTGLSLSCLLKHRTSSTHQSYIVDPYTPTFNLNIPPNQAMSPRHSLNLWLKFAAVWAGERAQAIAMWTATVLAICQQGYQIYQSTQSQKLATWAANNDFYQQCYELSPGVRSNVCNETLATPMSRPPFASDVIASVKDEQDNVIRNLTRRAVASTMDGSRPGKYSFSGVDHEVISFDGIR